MTEFINPIGKIREKFGNVIERLFRNKAVTFELIESFTRVRQKGS